MPRSNYPIERKFNVRYDRGDGTSSLYLAIDVDNEREAQKWADEFSNRYVGKPYPNGKGWYPFTNVQVIEIKCPCGQAGFCLGHRDDCPY